MSTAAIAIMAQRKKLIRRFKNAGATSIDTAINATDHGIRHSMIFQKLVRDGVIVNTNNNQFYLDEAAETELRKLRLRIIFMMLSVVAILFVIYLLVNRL